MFLFKRNGFQKKDLSCYIRMTINRGVGLKNEVWERRSRTK